MLVLTEKILRMTAKFILICLSVLVAIAFLPFYGGYKLLKKVKPKSTGKVKSANHGKKNMDNRDWIDRLEEYDALLHD